MTTNFTILLLNVGRRVELIRLFRSAFERLDVSGQIIATDVNGLAPALYEADHRYIFPHSSHPEFLDCLLTTCRDHNVGLVIPLIDPDLLQLSDNREIIQSNGIRVLLSNKKVIEICNDKQKTHDFLVKNGFPTAATMNLEDARRRPLPLFIKPRDGSGSDSAYKVNSLEELEFFAKYVRDPLIQKFIGGDEITTDVFCDWEGQPIAAIPRQRLKIRAGEVSVGRTKRIPKLEDLCMSVAQDIGAVGPINIQTITSNGCFHVIEINPRFGGGCPLSVKAGVPLVEWSIQMGMGKPVTCNESQFQEDLIMMRFDDSTYRTSGNLLK